MRFDFCIGNPPYQDETLGDNKGFAPPVYHLFLDNAYAVSSAVEMIHPARFLFNAGTTPKAWNAKMLNDQHLKVLLYEPNCKVLFPNTEINGGLAITYHDKTMEYGAIGTFTAYPALNSIIHKVKDSDGFLGMSSIAVSSYAYHFTPAMHSDFPEVVTRLSQGHMYDLKSNVLEKLPEIFHEELPADGYEYIAIMGRVGNERAFRYIRREYINNVVNLDKYKLFISKADGAAGTIGRPIPARILGTPTIGKPGTGSTESFLSIGCLDTAIEAENLLKYLKCRFTRTMLGVLKVTQDITPGKWEYVPLQDFTPASDIDWTQPIPVIDQQLYRKYGLTEEEIAFIESHVKEMT